MRKLQILSSFISILGFAFVISSCGPSAEEKARMEKERQDSINIATRKAEIRDSLRRDSITRFKNEARQKDITRDSTEIASLLPHFNIKQDPEFETKKMFIYKGISTSHFINNAYLSFATVQNKVEDLLLNVDIMGEWLKKDAIYIDYAEVIIGDENYIVSPSGGTKLEYKDTNKDISGEWMSGEVSPALMNNILEAKTIKINVVGTYGTRLISVSSNDLDKMKATIRLYKQMKEYGAEKVLEFGKP